MTTKSETKTDTKAPQHTSTSKYVIIWLALVGLTLTSFLFSLADIGSLEMPIALLIAVTKSTLVLLFFMHLIEQKVTNALVPIVAVTMLGLLLALMAADVATRHTFPPAPMPLMGSEGR